MFLNVEVADVILLQHTEKWNFYLITSTREGTLSELGSSWF